MSVTDMQRRLLSRLSMLNPPGCSASRSVEEGQTLEKKKGNKETRQDNTNKSLVLNLAYMLTFAN